MSLLLSHTDTNKLHNHILVNPVNEKQEKRDVIDKKEHLYKLPFLPTIFLGEWPFHYSSNRQRKERNIPPKVKEIQHRGGKSYRLDLFQKADFAHPVMRQVLMSM